MERKGFHDVDVDGDDSNDDTCGSCRNSIDFIRCDGWPLLRLTFFNTQAAYDPMAPIKGIPHEAIEVDTNNGLTVLKLPLELLGLTGGDGVSRTLRKEKWFTASKSQESTTTSLSTVK